MKNKLFDETFFKFIGVGIINTIFGTTIMFVCYNVFHLGYWLSSGANYFFGSILSFVLNKYFTFQNKEKSISQIVRFVINILVCYFVAYGVAKPLTIMLLAQAPVKVQENIAMLVGMCFFVGLNYLGQRFFAFREND